MDRLLEVKESEVRIEFELRTKCRATINLRNLMHTMHVAFKVQTTSPEMFSVKPPNGFIAPLGEYSFEVILMLQSEMPEHFPRSKDKFLVKSAMAPGGGLTERVPNEWFASRKKHVFLDAKLRVVYSGAFILRHLVARGELDPVKYLLKRQSEAPNRPDEGGRTALHIAAAGGRVEMVQALLEAGAAVDVLSKTGQTALLEAVYMGHSDVVKSLLERGADTEVRNLMGWTAIHLAASWNHLDILSLLIEKGAQLEARDSEGRTALHSAVTEGHVDCVKMLLDAGADKDARSVDGRTAVFRAAAKGDSLLVELLLECGASKSIKTLEGKSPYDIAVEKGHGAVLNALELGDGLLTAARKGDLEVVRRYLGKGAQVDAGDQYGWTALHCAAFKGHAEVVGELLAHGASVQSRDLEGHTPLHCAVETGRKDVVQLLIGRGADVNAQSVRGATPLNIAAALKYAGILRFLLHRGADRALVPSLAPDGCIPLDSAGFRRHPPRHTSLVFVQ
ncbi:hypothetical protein MPTK1_8g02160 [Marchantia polymorpha subsp. ruderalis]|uniref:MSP domain-containing protein n=1 Tax=Marchantia polymorpha TaxID=3197 RepID=A0A2R6XIV8_MARPO|nr:hypothetical protein MARPO_0012s0013 [Marchantia polymorpha]BBN18397.1 hypothetical protein Mp_8g02160 [Marchantia polymorpha subsp. ruderalis]|eukprot:PTQ46044.1 hypothetical protein MARPO_0012s0013 [Marchantia polymorpha]